MAGIEIEGLEFDAANRKHFSEKFVERGIDGGLIFEVLSGQPVFATNEPGVNRSGTHLMIGPSTTGRFHTIVLVEVDDDNHIWRPITGWPSTSKEPKLWQGES